MIVRREALVSNNVHKELMDKMLEMLKGIKSIIYKYELTDGKKDDVNQFIIMIMTYWTNVGSRGRAIITANLKRTLLSSLDLLTK